MKPPVIVILGETSLAIAQRIQTALPAKIYGLQTRTQSADVAYANFGDTVRQLFASGTPIIGICAAGILIRTLAPLLSDKRAEPPVLAIAEDGSAVVPLLGGLNGVNELARQIAVALEVAPAITTTGEVRFGIVLENPPPGYRLANPDQAKSFMSELLAGATVCLQGDAPWLAASSLPITANGNLLIQVTERSLPPPPDCLVYHPATIAIGIANTANLQPEAAIALVQQQLQAAHLAPQSLAGIFAPLPDAAYPAIHAIAQTFQIPARFFSPDQLAPCLETTADPAAAVLAAVGSSGQLLPIAATHPISLHLAVFPQLLDATTIGQAQGKLAIVGTGPGSAEWMSPEAKALLEAATDLVGYKTYLDLIGSLAVGKQQHESDNRAEEARARLALDLAATGRSVVVVSSGDPGIYAMATAVFEVIDHDRKPEWQSIAIQVAPGISAMQAAAAAIGAPLGHDFCAISLSDILKPWSIIEQRITAAAQGDFVIAFYNPVSRQRTWQLAAAQEILLQWRSPDTPVVLAKNLGRTGQSVQVCSLAEFVPEHADMRTLVLIGSSQTRLIPHCHNQVWVYTSRRYPEETTLSKK